MSDQKVSESRDRPRSRQKKRARARLRRLIVAGSVIAILIAAMLIDSAVYYNKVHAGVSVSGLSLGGLTRDEATAALTRYVQDAAKSPITLTSAGNKWTLLPSDVGTEIDVKQAVTAAMAYTRKSNFFMDAVRRFKLYFGGSSLPLTGTIDTALMDDFLAHLAEQVDVPPVNSGLALTGGDIKIVDGRKGNVVDQVALRKQLKSLLFSLHSTELPIPMVSRTPLFRPSTARKPSRRLRRWSAPR